MSFDCNCCCLTSIDNDKRRNEMRRDVERMRKKRMKTEQILRHMRRVVCQNLIARRMMTTGD